MSQQQMILLAIFVPLGFFLLVFLLVYLFGNVYNGLAKRRNKVDHSWHELSKGLIKAFDMIPSALQNVKVSSEQRDTMILIYKSYQTVDFASLSSVLRVAELDNQYGKAMADLKASFPDDVTIGFILETRRMNDFSKSLFNHNVRDYMRFKKMPINRHLSQVWKFMPYDEFAVPGQAVNSTTLDFRMKNMIDK